MYIARCAVGKALVSDFLQILFPPPLFKFILNVMGAHQPDLLGACARRDWRKCCRQGMLVRCRWGFVGTWASFTYTY